jgi:hypothetical protein
MSVNVIRIVSRESNGSLRVREYRDLTEISRQYEQIGIDDCNTELTLRGYPLFRGLIGPMADGRNAARYETPGVFEALTKEWAMAKSRRRRAKTLIPPAHFPQAAVSASSDFVSN